MRSRSGSWRVENLIGGNSGAPSFMRTSSKPS
jgi:hypothetical protein